MGSSFQLENKRVFHVFRNFVSLLNILARPPRPPSNTRAGAARDSLGFNKMVRLRCLVSE